MHSHNHTHGHNFRYNEAERRKRQNPETILESINLSSGMVFVDLGCNDGFFTIPAAKIVGKTGKVIAIDSDDEALKRLQAKAAINDIQNISIIHSDAETVEVNKITADVIFLGMVLHDFYDPVKALKNAKAMLKPGGLIYDYDWRKKREDIGPPYEVRFNKEHVKQLGLESGLSIVSSTNIDETFYGIVLN